MPDCYDTNTVFKMSCEKRKRLDIGCGLYTGSAYCEPIDAETLLATPLPPVQWLIPDLLPMGLSLLAGASKTGKSTFLPLNSILENA